MKSTLIAAIACATLFTVATSAQAERPHGRLFGGTLATRGDTWAQQQASSRPWHGNYYYLPYGQPTALVVPPNAVMQTNYSWGISQNTMTPIYHQYGYSVSGPASGAFLATPPWPSNTNQFGIYPVRAPW